MRYLAGPGSFAEAGGGSGIGSFAILKLLDATVGVRVSREQEVEGLDLALHDGRAYNH